MPSEILDTAIRKKWILIYLLYFCWSDKRSHTRQLEKRLNVSTNKDEREVKYIVTKISNFHSVHCNMSVILLLILSCYWRKGSSMHQNWKIPINKHSLINLCRMRLQKILAVTIPCNIFKPKWTGWNWIFNQQTHRGIDRRLVFRSAKIVHPNIYCAIFIYLLQFNASKVIIYIS